MAKITLVRPHTLGKTRAKAIVDQVAADLSSKYQVQSAWQGDTLVIKRSGLDGTLAVSETEVDIQVNLGFLLSAVKPVIEREINDQLNAKLS
jgi:putative polyhydroxyalkanoate system protein